MQERIVTLISLTQVFNNKDTGLHTCQILLNTDYIKRVDEFVDADVKPGGAQSRIYVANTDTPGGNYGSSQYDDEVFVKEDMREIMKRSTLPGVMPPSP
jgi:hypothetical protein